MKNKHLFLIDFLFTLAGNLNAQSFFKPLPKATKKLTLGADPAVTPISMNSFRPVANVAAYSIPGNEIFTGAGISYQHLLFDNSTQKWTAQWSISALLYAGTSLTPNTSGATVSPGIMVGALNNLVMIGATYANGQVLALVGIGISLNN